MISRALVDYTEMERAISHILDEIYAPFVLMRNHIGVLTSFFHTSMVLHPGSDDHLHILKFIYEGLLSSSSKKQQNRNVSLNNVVLGIDYKLTINMLRKQLYIAV